MIFNQIDILGFRGIKEAHINGLKNVNLFFGRNNCGKSSVLDAVFLISGLSNPKLPFNINILRDYRKLGRKDIALDFYGLDTTKPISIAAKNGETRRLKINLLQTSDTEIDLLDKDNNVASSQTDNKYGLMLDYEIEGNTYRSDIVFVKDVNGDSVKQEVHIDGKYDERLSCRYLNSKFDFYTSIDGLVNILKNKDEKFVIDALRIIEPKLQDFVLSEREVLVDIGMSQRIPINMMGDGARKLLAILTTIYECADGIVLIDEISNGFHYSVMGRLWTSIIEAARKNRVQVFATTHDKDSIKGLRDAVRTTSIDNKNSVASFKLQKTKNDALKAYHYSFESLDYSLNQEIEIR